MTRPSLLLAVPLLALSNLASADFYSHRYAGFSFGNADQAGFCEATDARINRFASDTQDVTERSCEGADQLIKLYGGWRWTPNLAVEASVQQLDDSNISFTVTNDRGEFLQFEEEIETRLASAYVVGHLPLFGGASLFAKAGGGLWTGTLNGRQRGELLAAVEEDGEIREVPVEVRGRAAEADNGFHWSYGAGISYRNEDNWTVRAEWETFQDIGSDTLRGAYDLESVSLGWSLHF
ncbi:outer membrane beta-barrel protein [Microbulbifer guangxiensis]|uniref:outer membrane beta-barrel protein n=1 Tax=Microbulbifer guangxiensis TaxID=2904249 RepID=UPI001F29F10F|nr:outer membrane beta-barrel protein [Microbulbifer guangxiensis]